eukprot:2127253-Amphidinium_carterae.3
MDIPGDHCQHKFASMPQWKSLGTRSRSTALHSPRQAADDLPPGLRVGTLPAACGQQFWG